MPPKKRPLRSPPPYTAKINNDPSKVIKSNSESTMHGRDAIDPLPREYPTHVTLIRRVGSGPSVAAPNLTCEEIRTWLLSDALGDIALHMGEVFFGNMGTPKRLDFTVIGRAVNEVSQVEALTKELDRPILVSEPVARLLNRELEDMGSHQLRGFSGSVGLYSLSSIDNA